ncbi:hypothetical protein ASE75_05125 [Sphingomonas sp. Leaf17]|nr:hypothetical protein ASE75_05125 [Sphingomonas sp. Leaf17]
MRRLIAFPCAGETLVGTLDEGDGPTGLLIVSGGNELRCGAHRGMAMLAADLAEQGIPVFRYDRRGIGDSSGVNAGYDSAGADLAAALATFRAAMPGMTRVAGFGNCDAATTLALFGDGLDALILANPWIDAAGDDGLPPTAAIRARYAARARDPETWLRLLRGGINLRNVGRGIVKLLRDRAAPTTIAGTLARRLSRAGQPLTILIATGDATGIAFEDALRTSAFAATTDRARVIRIATASHSFARPDDKRALTNGLVSALR